LIPLGLVKNLERIISRDLIFEMNYAGSCGQIGFVSYVNVNNALFGKEQF